MKNAVGAMSMVLLMVISPVSAEEHHDTQAVPQEQRLAVLPLPSDLRAGAGIVRWTSEGKIEQVRKSLNGFSCSLDAPGDDRFDVRCYTDGMWPALEMRRSLGKQFESYAEITAKIEEAIRNGTLAFPMEPTAGYRMLGPIEAIDPATGETGPEMNDWQSIHFPFQTSQMLGLTEKEEVRQDDPMPFVMASGRWWSHVMIMHGEWKPLKSEK